MNDLRKAAEELLEGVGACVTCGAPKSEWLVYAVNISAERVDETAKRKHEPDAPDIVVVDDSGDGSKTMSWVLNLPLPVGTRLYTAPPISDYHEGWEEGFKAATSEHEPFIYVREDNERPFGGYEHCSEADAGAFPVYTAPMIYTPRPKKEWVGLTANEIWKCNKAEAGSAVEFHICSAHQNVMDFAEAIEAKLKERNCG